MRVVLVFWGIISGLAGTAQNAPLDRATFLRAATAISLPATDSSAADLPKFSWIDSYELRTETDEFDFGRQEYGLRFNLSSGAIRRAQRNLAELYQASSTVESLERTYDLRYAAVKDWNQLQLLGAQLPWLDSLLLVVEDRITVLERLAVNDAAAFPKALDARADRRKLVAERAATEDRRTVLLDRYGLPATSVPATNDALSVRQIAVELENAPARIFDPRFAELALESDINAEESELKNAEQRQRLDFLQLTYRGPQRDPFEERLSLQAAFQLSTDGKRRLQLAELAAEKRANDATLQWRAQERGRRVARLTGALQVAINAYRTEAAAWAQTADEWRRYLEVRRQAGSDPQPELDWLERRYRFALAQLEREASILEDYWEWRMLRGELP